MDTTHFSKNPERLLAEAGFAGAMYGMYMPVMSIATYLGKMDKTRPASILMLGLLNISLKNYDGAREIFTSFLATKSYEAYHGEAKALLETANKISPPKDTK